MRALLAAMRSEKGDLDGNLARHLELLDQAASAGCDITVFPEFSLTGYSHTAAVTLDDPHVVALAKATTDTAALFGIAERGDHEAIHITQVLAERGEIQCAYRKRYLMDEPQYTPGDAPCTFTLGGEPVAAVICAEGGHDDIWDEAAARGVRAAFYCSAPGLYGARRTDEAAWRDGFDWWDRDGLGDACRQARRLGLWVAMATQAGATVDEDFPGIAALINPQGEVVDRLPDWREGTLVVDIG